MCIDVASDHWPISSTHSCTNETCTWALASDKWTGGSYHASTHIWKYCVSNYAMYLCGFTCPVSAHVLKVSLLNVSGLSWPLWELLYVDVIFDKPYVSRPPYWNSQSQSVNTREQVCVCNCSCMHKYISAVDFSRCFFWTNTVHVL